MQEEIQLMYSGERDCMDGIPHYDRGERYEFEYGSQYAFEQCAEYGGGYEHSIGIE